MIRPSENKSLPLVVSLDTATEAVALSAETSHDGALNDLYTGFGLVQETSLNWYRHLWYLHATLFVTQQSVLEDFRNSAKPFDDEQI